MVRHTFQSNIDTAYLKFDYRCARCSVVYASKPRLIRHMSVGHKLLKRKRQKYEIQLGSSKVDLSELAVFNGLSLFHQQCIYKCSKCPQTFKSNCGLSKHLSSKHGITNKSDYYKCENCGKTFSKLQSFQCHSVFHKPPQFSCNKCDRKYFAWAGLVAHTRSAHLGITKITTAAATTKFPCPQCSQKFATAVTLRGHLARIHNPKEHKCAHCCADYRTEVDLKIHLLKAHSLVDSKCEICQKEFKNQRGLMLHSRFHGNPTLSCGQCTLKFYATPQLSQHTKRAHGEKFDMPTLSNCKNITYACAVCCRQFAFKDNLRPHLKIHYYRPQVCPVCGQTFTSEMVFKRHKRNKHVDPISEPTQCDICSREFPSHDGYLKHMKYHKKPTLVCPDCPLLFYTIASTKNHSNAHNSKTKSGQTSLSSGTFRCDICSTLLPSRWLLKAHLNAHYSSSTFSCSKCDFQCHVKVTLMRHFRNFH